MPVLFQVLVRRLDLVGISRAKSSLVVDVDNIGILKTQDHNGVMVAVDINEAQCNGDQGIAVPIKMRADIDARFRGIL